MENPVKIDEKKLKYNEYMKKYRQDHLEKSRETSRANYHKRMEKKRLFAILGKEIDINKYTKEQIVEIEHLHNTIKDAKNKYPDLF
jgi:hypothetical protein